MVRRGRFGSEDGKSRLGCLFTLFLLSVGVFYGFRFFEVRFRYYQIQDEVRTQASFAPAIDDETIRARLVARSDKLGIPLGARAWRIRRTSSPRMITIQAEYQDSVVIELPGYRRVFRFQFNPGVSELY